MKNTNQLVIRVENSEYGLDILITRENKEYYLATHRSKGLLWTRLRDGVTLGELRRIKPTRTKVGHKYHHYLHYILKLVDDFIKFEFKE